MARRERDFLPRDINQHTPDMAYSADVQNSGAFLANLGTPLTADNDWFVTGRTISGLITTGVTFTATQLANDTLSTHPYGAAITFIIAGTATVGRDMDVTVFGRDYLGAPVQEVINDASTQGAVTQTGVKAFAFIDSVSVAAGSVTNDTATGSFQLGFSGTLGLPYKAMGVGIDVENDSVVGTGGTFVAGASASTATVAQTATTADPRGTWAPGDVPDGSTNYKLEVFCDRTNLHGNQQFRA